MIPTLTLPANLRARRSQLSAVWTVPKSALGRTLLIRVYDQHGLVVASIRITDAASVVCRVEEVDLGRNGEGH